MGIKMTPEYSNSTMVDALLIQRKAHDSLINALSERIGYLEEEEQLARDENFAAYLFFSINHRELVTEFVELCYIEIPDSAKKAVEALHDETLDLSTLPCTGRDFKPWPYR
jgi:hypothetical protein